MTSIPHPVPNLDLLSTKVVRALFAATGPLTVEEIRERVGPDPTYPPGYGDVYVRLQRLAGAGWVDTMKADRCRIWWWTRRG